MDSVIPPIEVDFQYVPVINFAMQQNHVPVIRRFIIKNNSDTDLQNIEVSINVEPDFAIDWTKKIDLVPAKGSLDLGLIDIKISTKYLSELTERIAGILTVTVNNNSQSIYKEAYSVDILAYDQWGGMSILPEILSAFITPNHPEIPKIIKRASAVLQQWTGNPSFDEYQTRSADRIKKQMAAIYEAIAEREIVYSSVPASFEESGQRIRMSDTIFAQQLGNCLDLSLLYASCLEAVGINPIVIIIKGHAFAGAWLVNESFPDGINDDLSLLTKRIAEGINEIAIVESTCMNAGHKSSFDNAIAAGSRHLINEADFQFFVDVKRTRFSGIRPLPLRIKTINGWEVTEDIISTRSSDTPDDIIVDAKLVSVDHVDISKQQLWERKLLDLSLRNNLLNLRISKGTIQLISVSLNQLEDKLAAGEEFQILAKPADWDNPLRDAGVYRAINHSDPIADLVKHELSQKRLRSYLTEAELSNSLVNLYRASRLSIEENGANTLYVALGLLKWYETGLSERPRYAPILLLPIEIVRKTAQKGYIIRSREEDAIMNITLLEMIRQDFGITIGGLESLPKDESGVDVKLVFNIIRQAIMSKARWDIEEQAFLGTFSFSKFIMWNDIHSNSDKLSRNKIVASLIAGKMIWQVPQIRSDDKDYDKSYHPSEIALPISADSSQLEAICAAAENSSFILHGPPGTGKSQTITNIIANSLYQGKKVLFVAEKMAALTVVQNRLNAIGIGSFCLELHSNKSKKSIVLEHLKKVTEVIRNAKPGDFSSEAERIHKLRAELNGYVEALHKVYHFGYSLFDIFTGCAELESIQDKINFPDKIVSDLTKEKITQWTDIAADLQAIGTICGHPHGHPLAEIHLAQYSQQSKNEAKRVIANYIESLKELKNASEEVRRTLKAEIELNERAQYTKLQMISEYFLNIPNIPSGIIAVDNIEQVFSEISEIAKHGEKRDGLRSDLLSSFNKKILSYDAEQCLLDWTRASKRWFLPRILRQNKIKKGLTELAINGRVETGSVVHILQLVANYKREQEVIEHNASFLSPILGFLWQGGNCEWKKILSVCRSMSGLNEQAVALFGSVVESKKWRQSLSYELSEGSKSFLTVNEKYLKRYIDALSRVAKQENELVELLVVDFDKLQPQSKNIVENCQIYAGRWLENIEGLRDWTNWNQAKDKANSAELSQLVAAYENNQIGNDEVLRSFKKGVMKSCAEFIFSREPVLSSFNGELFEEKIKRFREISKQFEQLTKDELCARLASKVPLFTQEASQSSEISILQRAIRNGGRGLSIRKLFDSISNLLPRLCPCMLMSPISVAQYFDANTTKFDLVVFDEASQMPTCEAVGAIARGANVIIVGDPQQMPPTNFFSSNSTDEDNEMEDLESILDDCLALSLPSKHLLWHYRSKHESLIAFSNSKYYENKLLTFPSPDDITSRVNYVPVDGYYDRSKTRQNLSEATAIVKEIVRRLSDPVLSKLSIGVVTFSSVQQLLIDDLLNEALKTNAALEAVALNSEEPLFIKNLENVQGDERDIILFSVGYGPDKDRHVSLNFGPLNRKGGERRLNVAVSRARYEMKVFSTLKSEQIDLSRTSSEGMAGLKAFLEYAEKGKTILSLRSSDQRLQAGGFVESLAGQIKAYGYHVHTNVGCSKYRIDIGVVNSENKSEYVLGILCDGHNYSAAKTAKDREIVQHDVLKALGWNIHKVWSAEWWENSEKIIEGVIKAIKNAEIQSVSKTEIIAAKPKTETPISSIQLNSLHAGNIIETNKRRAQSGVEYGICNLEKVQTTSSDDFLQFHNRQKICAQIAQVIEAEAPISRNLLCKRVLSAWGISRSGTRISAQFIQLFSSLNLNQTGTKCVFFWKNEQNPEFYDTYRVARVDSEKRDAEDLPPEEIANAIKEVVQSQISLSKEELIKEVAKIFGFARIGNNVEASISMGIHVAVLKKYAFVENERIVLIE